MKESSAFLNPIRQPWVTNWIPCLVNLYQDLEQKVAAEPGVLADSVSLSTFNQGAWRTPVSVLGATPNAVDNPHVVHNAVGAGYFATMGIPLLIGRIFGPQDTATSPKVAVINKKQWRASIFRVVLPLADGLASKTIPHTLRTSKSLESSKKQNTRVSTKTPNRAPALSLLADSSRFLLRFPKFAIPAILPPLSLRCVVPLLRWTPTSRSFLKGP